MTRILKGTEPRRRPGVLGVHSLDHYSLTVPDLREARAFYESFGLDVREKGNDLHLHAGGDHAWGVLSEGPAKRLRSLSFGAFPDDLPRFRSRLERLGIETLKPPPGEEAETIWFHSCDGTPIAIRAADKSSPNAKSPFSNPSAPPAERGAPIRGQAPVVRPRRMAHVLLFARDIPRIIGFAQDTLGLRLSDEAGVVAFLHGVHGSDHHLVAFAKSDAPGFHHASWDVGSIHEVGLGAMQMADRGHAAGWGLGRHVLGSNYFHYVRDPWGSYAEYSSDIDYIPADADWPAGHFTPENGFYLWGPTPPADFATNYETAAAADFAHP